jgi:CelD/BcsL family acetyltransferase involved in cellulose biosynthesis
MTTITAEDRTFALERVTELDNLRADWPALATASKNVFATWEWISTWWRHFGAGRTLAITACRDSDGALRAIVPCYVWKSGPLRILRFLGHRGGGQLGPICAPDDRALAAEALRATLASVRHDLFLGENLSPHDAWTAAVGARVQQRFPSPLLRLDFDDWDAYLASLSSNFRQQLRRKERNLSRDHALGYRLVTDRAELEREFDTFLALHSARWDGEQSLFLDGGAVDFHRDFAALAADQGWARLWLLELGGTPAAAWYGFRFAAIETYYQLGRDPRFEGESVGLLAVANSIRAALADRMETYRFGPGGLGYKYRFGVEDPGLENIARSATLAGRTAFAGGQLIRRSGPLKQVVRRRLVR